MITARKTKNGMYIILVDGNAVDCVSAKEYFANYCKISQ